MVNVFDVANYILHSIGGEMSTMKLQKLCYYAQSWHLVWNNNPLFPEEFEAWVNGPVCKPLFDLHKGMFWIDENFFAERVKKFNSLNETEKKTLDKVIETYGQFTGAQLSELSHAEEPWKSTKHDSVIPQELMKSYYKSLK